MKNNFKKGLSLIVAVAMMFSLVTGLNAFAAGEKTLTVVSTIADNSTVKVGDMITQTISLADFANVVDGIRGFALSVKFDTTKLLATKAEVGTAGNIVNGELAEEAGVGEISVVDSSDISGNIPAGTLNIVYADKGEGEIGTTFHRTPALAGDVLTITYEALAVGDAIVTVEALQDTSFIDCSGEATSAVGTNLDTLAVQNTITVIPAQDPELTPVALSTLAFDTTGAYIYGFNPETAVADVAARFEDSANVVVTGDVDGVLATGSVISLEIGGVTVDSAIVVILGDVDGNGIIDSSDYIKLKSVVLSIQTVTDAFLLAANVDGNLDPETSEGLVDSSDYIKLKSVVLNIQTIVQGLPA